MRNEQVEKVVEFLRENVQCYPQVSDDEPCGYYSETDKMMDEAADLLERLQSRIEALEKDAARYRWLRRKVCIVGGKFHILNLDPRYIAPDAAVELDAAIDAALAKATGQKGGDA